MKQQDQGSVIFPLIGVFKCCAILWPCLPPMLPNSMGVSHFVSSLLVRTTQSSFPAIFTKMWVCFVEETKTNRSNNKEDMVLQCLSAFMYILCIIFHLSLCFCVTVNISIISKILKNFNFWQRICPGASIQEDFFCVWEWNFWLEHHFFNMFFKWEYYS